MVAAKAPADRPVNRLAARKNGAKNDVRIEEAPSQNVTRPRSHDMPIREQFQWQVCEQLRPKKRAKWLSSYLPVFQLQPLSYFLAPDTFVPPT